MGSDWRARAGTQFSTSKQEVVASRLVVATNHPLASAAGMEVFARGGNAVDAAVAAAVALTVVEPMMVSIFGAGMIVLRDGATGEIANVDDYACAPAAATPDMYRQVGPNGGAAGGGTGDPFATVGRENAVGYRAVGVPGALQAWTALLAERGRLRLSEVMAPAIRAAEGFGVSPYLAHCTAQSAGDLAAFRRRQRCSCRRAVRCAPESGWCGAITPGTLESIAGDGPRAFTGGPIAEAVAADMARNGGLITLEDLAAYRFHQRTPVRGRYRGYEIVSAAPTSSGGTHIVQALNILEGFDVGALGFGTAESIHLLAETLKICFADRGAYVGDPATVDVPVAWLTSKDYAAERRREIDPTRARSMAAGQRPDGAPAPSGALAAGESANTTHLTVIDGDGNVVCMTQTLNTLFGSKVTVPGTGMLLNNCMMLFDPRPGGPNSVAPRKRMLSSMSPTIVLKDGRPALALGTPGGTRIFPAVLQAILNVLDHGMTLQEAVEAPRVWTQGGALEVEEAVPEAVRAALRDRGHEVKPVARVAGGMNGVLVDPQCGLLRGAACWRADGTPMGMSGGYTDRATAPGVPL